MGDRGRTDSWQDWGVEYGWQGVGWTYEEILVVWGLGPK
jgi:hypothetical protein